MLHGTSSVGAAFCAVVPGSSIPPLVIFCAAVLAPGSLDDARVDGPGNARQLPLISPTPANKRPRTSTATVAVGRRAVPGRGRHVRWTFFLLSVRFCAAVSAPGSLDDARLDGDTGQQTAENEHRDRRGR